MPGMPALPWSLTLFCPLKPPNDGPWDFLSRGSGGTGTVSVHTRQYAADQIGPRWKNNPVC
jgi:hypothetical protein